MLAEVKWNKDNAPIGYRILRKGEVFDLEEHDYLRDQEADVEVFELAKARITGRNELRIVQTEIDTDYIGSRHGDHSLPNKFSADSLYGPEINEQPLLVKRTFLDYIKGEKRQICHIVFNPKKIILNQPKPQL